MAKAPSRTRTTKKKLQDVMDSIPEDTDVRGAAADADVEAETQPESKFVATETAPRAAPPSAPPQAMPDDDESDDRPRRKPYVEGESPIDRETHEKYERVKRGELHITDL